MIVRDLILTATAIVINITAEEIACKPDQPDNSSTVNAPRMTQLEIDEAWAATIYRDPLPPDVEVPIDDWEDDIKKGNTMEGDIILTKEQRGIFPHPSEDYSRKLFNVEIKPQMRWPDGKDGWPEIPYTTSNLSKKLQKMVQDAMKYWQKHTCVIFTPATNLKRPYVGIRKFTSCSSRVGRTNKAAQLLGLTNTCSLGSTIHELGHTLGYFHEQQRYDREEYINVNNHNVKDKCGGRVRGCDPNFVQKKEVDMFSGHIPYDMGSIMHYGPKMFTKPKGAFTITAKDNELSGVLGQRSRLTHRDIHLINFSYKCSEKWMAKCGLRSDPCMNEGYIMKNCKCSCPPGTSGKFCEKKNGDYYDNVKPPCNRHITSATTISASQRDVHKLRGDFATPAAWCVFTIDAPPCNKPVITIKKFKIPDMSWRAKVKCKFAWVEFKENYHSNGDMYCGKDLRPGKKIIGDSRKMTIFFNIMSKLRGEFKADIQFVRDEQCDAMADEALGDSPFGPITTGNCNLEVMEGFVWKSQSNYSEICTLFFSEAPEPFALRLEFVDLNPNNTKCHHYIRYCLHEKRCSVLNSDMNKATIPSSSAVFEYVPNDSSCSFELHIFPEQSYCQQIMMVDSENTESVQIIDVNNSHCELWCKTMENRQVQVKLQIFREILCNSEEEWIEISTGPDDNKRKNLCVQSITEQHTVENSIGWYYTYNAEDNHFFIKMKYNASYLTPITVTCSLGHKDNIGEN